MPRVEITDVLDDIDLEEYANRDNIFYFESFCSACDHFDTQECPFYTEVFPSTKWKDVGCDNFYD